jgi:hypothetical protein
MMLTLGSVNQNSTHSQRSEPRVNIVDGVAFDFYSSRISCPYPYLEKSGHDGRI